MDEAERSELKTIIKRAATLSGSGSKAPTNGRQGPRLVATLAAEACPPLRVVGLPAEDAATPGVGDLPPA